MKKLFIVVAVFINIYTQAQEAIQTKGPELKKGLHLVYNVTQGEKEYQYIVDFTSVSNAGVVFDWKMTDPVNKSGVITLTAKALKEGDFLHFYPSTITYDGKDICMIVGKSVYDKLASFKEGDSWSLSCDCCFREVTVNAVENQSYTAANQTDLKTFVFRSIYNNGTFEVLNNPDFPLIVYFDFNMTISLASYSNN